MVMKTPFCTYFGISSCFVTSLGRRDFSRSALSSRRGAALLIALCAVVLLTGVVLAFFSQASLNRQISASSTQYSRADFFARSAAEDILGEMRREIIESSDEYRGDPSSPNPDYPPV
ncbi:MAG: hypothetical protein ACAI35_04290, partial [Candidatus Methylacidiphilales bacterium]